MINKKGTTMQTTVSHDTRNAVETAIDLSKEGSNITWESRIREIRLPVDRWIERSKTKTATRP